jgi:DNA-binding transcriptional ArsR family regulator
MLRNMAFERTRDVTDPKALRAMAHPTRLALLELLAEEGPLTATQAAEHVGESPANCSFHLRTLAKYGYVREAPGGRGRQRPWQVVRTVQEIREEELGPEARVAAEAFSELLYDRHTRRRRAWIATRSEYPGEWRDAGGEMTGLLHLTAAELHDLGEQILALASPYAERERAGGRPEGSLPVAILVDAFPLRPPSMGPPATGAPSEQPTPSEES